MAFSSIVNNGYIATDSKIRVFDIFRILILIFTERKRRKYFIKVKLIVIKFLAKTYLNDNTRSDFDVCVLRCIQVQYIITMRYRN